MDKSPPYTYPNPTRYFICNFLIVSFIFIKNKCFSDVIWKKLAKRWIQTRVDRVKRSITNVLSSAPLKLTISQRLL